MEFVLAALCTLALIGVVRLTGGRVARRAASLYPDGEADPRYRRDRELDGSWKAPVPWLWMLFFGFLMAFNPARATPGFLGVAFLGALLLSIPRYLHAKGQEVK